MAERGLEFEAGGVKRRLHLGAGAMLAYERMSRQVNGDPESVLEAAEKLREGSLSMERLVRLFHCALIPKVSEDEAVEVLDAVGFVPGMELLGKALEQTLVGLNEEVASGN